MEDVELQEVEIPVVEQRNGIKLIELVVEELPSRPGERVFDWVYRIGVSVAYIKAMIRYLLANYKSEPPINKSGRDCPGLRF